VIVACVRGSIPASTLDTLRNDLGLNRAPAETILRKTHLAACEHMRRMIHTRRAIEALAMGPQGIVTKLFQRDKMRRGRPPHGNAPPSQPVLADPGDPMAKRSRTQFWRFGVLFSVFFLCIGDSSVQSARRASTSEQTRSALETVQRRSGTREEPRHTREGYARLRAGWEE
jgi:hypothetical protein